VTGSAGILAVSRATFGVGLDVGEWIAEHNRSRGHGPLRHNLSSRRSESRFAGCSLKVNLQLI